MNRNNIVYITLVLLLSMSFPGLSAQKMVAEYDEMLFWKSTTNKKYLPEDQYLINLSISHGHCQTPIEARFTEVNISYRKVNMEDLKIDFEVATNSMFAVHDPVGEATQNLKGPGSFDSKRYPAMSFTCKNTYRLGKNWFQLNGTMTIRGKSLPVMFHARPVYGNRGSNRVLRKFVLDGELDLKEFGFSANWTDTGEPRAQRMYMNMVLLADGC